MGTSPGGARHPFPSRAAGTAASSSPLQHPAALLRVCRQGISTQHHAHFCVYPFRASRMVLTCAKDGRSPGGSLLHRDYPSFCKAGKRSWALSQFWHGQGGSRLCPRNAFAQPGWKLSLVGLLCSDCLNPRPHCHIITPRARQEQAPRGRNLHPTPQHAPAPGN